VICSWNTVCLSSDVLRLHSSDVLRLHMHMPTGQKVLLTQTSMHNPSVHASWPIAEMKRIYDRSSIFSNFVKARNTLLKQFEFTFMDPRIVDLARQWSPHHSSNKN